MESRTPVPRPAPYPFATNGIRRDSDGIAHYEDLPRSLVAVLRQWADATPWPDAVIEVGGPRLTYGELHERTARVAGGLRAEGLSEGDRVAVRYPAGVRWVLASGEPCWPGASPSRSTPGSPSTRCRSCSRTPR